MRQVDYATKLWANDHANVTFDETQLWENFCQEEKIQLFNDTYSSEEEKENARAILENVDQFDGEINNVLANIFADAVKANACETEEIDRRVQELGDVFNVTQEDSDGVKKFTIIENLLDKLGARDDVVMINSAEDLETLGFSPEKAQEIFSQVGKKGMYSAENDKVYMLPSHFKNGVDAFRTFAHFFRNKSITEEEAGNKGLLSRAKGQAGWALGKYAGDELYTQYRNGKISDERAAAIARGAPNDVDVQRAALASSQGMDATTLEIHTRRLAAFKDENVSENSGEQIDLFGDNDAAMQEMVALSKAAGALVKENKQKILAVKGVVRRPEIAREMGVDINDPEAVKEAINALEYENSRLMSPTPEIEILNKIRRKAGFAELVEENQENVENSSTVDDGSMELGVSGSVKDKKTQGKLTSKLASRISEFINELKGKALNDEQIGIASVATGRKKFYHIRIDDLGNVVAFLKGSRDKSGANHIMLKHYGENARMGYVSAEEILNIGEIIRDGNLEVIDDNERRYSVEDPNYKGRKLTVVVKKSYKKKQPDFVFTFYSNKKSQSGAGSNQALGATPSVLSTSTVPTQSENNSQSQGNSFSGSVGVMVDSIAKSKDFKKQIDEVRAKYENTPMWLKAPNGQPTKLTEAQWLAVRTPNFKRWFGDWETLAIINEIKKLPTLKLKKATSDYSTTSKVKALFDSFGVAENSRNGQSVIFAKGSVGKIIGHKSDVPISEVLDSFKDLFESSVLAIEEKEVLKEGHKEHTNFKGYEHYVNKFNYNGKPYYIRFTVQVENAKPQTIKKGYVPRKVHSSMITDVSIYKENSQSNTDLSTSGTKGVPIFDNKLADFLNSVNEKDVSKVVDENGEPLVVYHGTRKSFTVFDKEKIGTGKGTLLGKGFYFSSRKSNAKLHANGIYSQNPKGGIIVKAFLDIKNPFRDVRGYIPEEYDGVIYEDIYCVPESNQIKSATNNSGAYSRGNPSINGSVGVRNTDTKPNAKIFNFTKKEREIYDAAIVPLRRYNSTTEALKATKESLNPPKIVKNKKLKLDDVLSSASLNEMKNGGTVLKTKFTTTADVHSVALANVKEFASN